MNLSRLRHRRRTADPDPGEGNHQAVFAGLLDVLLIGMGAAATLVIIFAVLPKMRGWLGKTGGTSASVAPTLAAQVSMMRAELQPVDEPLILIQVEARNPNASIPAEWIDVRGMKARDTRRWVMKGEAQNWRRIFVSHEVPDDPGGIRIVCKHSDEIVSGEELTISVLVNGVPGCARAIFSRETRVGGAASPAAYADYFRILPADNRVQAIPARPLVRREDALIGGDWLVAQINTDLRGTPVTGYTDRNLPNP